MLFIWPVSHPSDSSEHFLHGSNLFRGELKFLKTACAQILMSFFQESPSVSLSKRLAVPSPPSPSLSSLARSGQRHAGQGQAGGGDQTHPEGTALPGRPSSEQRPHDGAAPARHLLEPGERWVPEHFPAPWCRPDVRYGTRYLITVGCFPSGRPDLHLLVIAVSESLFILPPTHCKTNLRKYWRFKMLVTWSVCEIRWQNRFISEPLGATLRNIQKSFCCCWISLIQNFQHPLTGSPKVPLVDVCGYFLLFFYSQCCRGRSRCCFCVGWKWKSVFQRCTQTSWWFLPL